MWEVEKQMPASELIVWIEWLRYKHEREESTKPLKQVPIENFAANPPPQFLPKKKA